MLGISLLMVAVPTAMAVTLNRVRSGRQVIAGVVGLILGIQVGASYLAHRVDVAWDGIARGAEESPASPATEEKTAAPVADTVTAEVTSETSPTASAAKADTKGSELSGLRERPEVPIVSDVRYLSENRPAWLEMAPAFERGEMKVAVRGGPYQKARDCEADLEHQVQQVVRDFIREHLHSDVAPTLLTYTLKDLRTKHVVQQEFSEQLATRFGVMSQVHAQLVFDQSFQNELDDRWQEIRSKSRLLQLGLGVGVLMLFLATLFGFLRIDTATRGSYTGRLQFGAAAMILTLVAASVLLAKWIPWL